MGEPSLRCHGEHSARIIQTCNTFISIVVKQSIINIFFFHQLKNETWDPNDNRLLSLKSNGSILLHPVYGFTLNAMSLPTIHEYVWICRISTQREAIVRTIINPTRQYAASRLNPLCPVWESQFIRLNTTATYCHPISATGSTANCKAFHPPRIISLPVGNAISLSYIMPLLDRVSKIALRLK